MASTRVGTANRSPRNVMEQHRLLKRAGEGDKEAQRQLEKITGEPYRPVKKNSRVPVGVRGRGMP